MDILLVLAGILFGVGITFGGIAVRRMYLDWRIRRNWAIAGRRWMEIMNVQNSRTGYPSTQTAEERLADLQGRVHMIITGEPIDDFDKQRAYIQDHPERLPEHEMEEHRERDDARERAYAGTPGYSKDKTRLANPSATIGNVSRRK